MIFIASNRSNSVWVNLGATNHSEKEREKNDYYATDPKAIDLLCAEEKFTDTVWECACGELHLSNRLNQYGYKTINTDLVVRCDGVTQSDFFNEKGINHYDIVTNPPYRIAQEFVEHAMDISADGVKVAMLLKLTFLESQRRKELFKKYPFRTLYVSSSRITCAMNGDFERYNASAIAYGWYVWVKGFKGDPIIKWIN